MNMNAIDHLIYTAPSLEEGMDHIESLLGMRPVIGGRHEKWGTHNALLSLGDAYLEVVAPCPDLPIPERGLWLAEYFEKPPQLATWALRTKQIEQVYKKGLAAGIELGEILNGQRQKPDGSLLSWQLTDPYPLPENGALPFLIDWGNSKHPSQSTPRVGELVSLTIYHPQPEMIKKKLVALDIELEVKLSAEIKLEALIKTSEGIVILT